MTFRRVYDFLALPAGLLSVVAMFTVAYQKWHVSTILLSAVSVILSVRCYCAKKGWKERK